MHKWFRPAVVLPVAVVVGLLIALGSGLRQQARGATPFGFATIGMHAPSGAQTIGASFSMQGSLDAFTPGSSDSWAGYDFELAYDSSILQIDSDTNGLCSASGWGLVTTTPHLVTGCAFQSSTSTGVLENITAHCIASGTSPLTLVPRNDPSSTQVGTALFDVNGNDFTMTLNNASVTCGNAVPPTATSTATATNTPTVTSTPTDTATPTPTATSTDTSTPTTPTATNTPRPTRTPLPGPVVLNGEWAPFSRCPVDSATMLAVDGHTAIDYCVAARSTAGSIKLGNSTSTTGGSDMQFGLSGLNPWTISLPQDGAILADPVDVPGGLLGLMCPSLDPVVTSVCNLATDNDLNRVTAAVESAGPLTDFDINAGLQVGAPIATLPIKVHLENPLLGSTCYIGSDADPIVLHPANIDLSHSSFSVVRFDADGTDDTQGPLQVVKLTGTTQGDSQFAVPAASGCGAAGALNTAINTKEGLPSPAGNNSIVLTNSSTYLASFTNSGDFYPYAGFDFSDDWHSAICPCATPTATNTPILPTLTVLPTITAIPTIGAGSCQGDTDCDGCGDTAELALKPPTDPLDPWDFYSVPVPALLVLPQPAGVVRDRVVASSDAEAVFAYFKAGAHTGNTAYEQDLNQNGVKDGVEYDRSVMGPGQSGAPDGTVSASDAELAFAQFRLNYRC